MEKSLRSYDISSYELELDFNKQLSSIKKHKDKLIQTHETKSLKSHKDFLKKEQKHTKAIKEHEEKAILRTQRIERAVKNKIARLTPKKERKEKELQEFINNENANIQALRESLEKDVIELNNEKHTRQNEVSILYEENIKSYLDKLHIYQNNFRQNKTTFEQKVKKYQENIKSILFELENSFNKLKQDLAEREKKYLHDKELWQSELKQKFEETRHLLDQKTNHEQRQVNILLSETNEYVNNLRNQQKGHYETLIKQLETLIVNRKESFQKREQLIRDDLTLNLSKLQSRLDKFDNKTDKKLFHYIEKQMDLFKLRAETTLRYEQRLFDQELILLEQELRELKRNYKSEDRNIDKLLVIMKSDLSEQKSLAYKLNEISINLKLHLDNYEIINKEYLLRHEKLKAKFIKEYTRIFIELKQALIQHTEVYINQIAKHYMEMDEIQLFIDTSEPLREVEVNKLRKDIEISEIEERYQIKIAAKKHDYDEKVLKIEQKIEKEELSHREYLNHFSQQIAEIHAKESFDKQLEEAKLRYKKANILFNLRIDKLGLEQKLFKSDFETKLETLNLAKKEKELEIKRNYAIYKKQLDYRIKDYKLEAKYKMQVEQEKLEETIFLLKEKLNIKQLKQKQLKQALTEQLKQETEELEKQKQAIINNYEEKLALIDKALERELKIPTETKIKMEALVDERLKKLDQNNVYFVDFIEKLESSLNTSTDNIITLLQIDKLQKEVKKYIEKAYEVKKSALNFMYKLEKENISNNPEDFIETPSNKKIQKRLERLDLEYQKQLNELDDEQLEYINQFKIKINQEIRLLPSINELNEEKARNIADELYNKVFYQLNETQNKIKEETLDIYNPLTEEAEKIIKHATNQAAIARNKVIEKQNKDLEPIEKQINQVKQKIDNETNQQLNAINTEITNLRKQIQTTKTEVLEKIKQIEQARDENIKTVKEEIANLDKLMQEDLKEMIKQLDEEIEALSKPYKDTMQNIVEQIEETKRIFTYEERIFTISKNSAESRYKDALIKANTVFQNNQKQYEYKRKEIEKKYQEKLQRLKDKLLEISRQHEQNIFTIRPRMEESMGDAKKEIEKQIKMKKERYIELEKQNKIIEKSAHKSLQSTYYNTIDKLEEILQQYSEMYRLIDEEFDVKKDSTNKLIRDDNNSFATSLLLANNMRHEALLKDLLSINKSLNRKEVK